MNTPIQINVNEGKNIYLASDFHLGAPDPIESRTRERRILRWIEAMKPTAAAFIFVGDMFDFWFEYTTAVPKGFIRFQAAIAALTDAGIPCYFFAGNHDLWMRKYFDDELGVQTYFEPVEMQWNNKKVWIGHGDGLGPGDHGFKLLKKYIFNNRLFFWMFDHLLPVNIGIGFAHRWSASRKGNMMMKREHFEHKDKEWLYSYALSIENQTHFDFYIFGHRHLPLDIRLNETSRYLNLGEWIHFNTYAVFDGRECTMHAFETENETIYV